MIQTFNELKAIVEPSLTSFHDDLNKWDRESLEKWDLPFIYGYRNTGTNMQFLHPYFEDWFGDDLINTPIFGTPKKIKDDEEARELVWSERIWVTHQDRNSKFL